MAVMFLFFIFTAMLISTHAEAMNIGNHQYEVPWKRKAPFNGPATNDCRYLVPWNERCQNLAKNQEKGQGKQIAVAASQPSQAQTQNLPQRPSQQSSQQQQTRPVTPPGSNMGFDLGIAIAVALIVSVAIIAFIILGWICPKQRTAAATPDDPQGDDSQEI